MACTLLAYLRIWRSCPFVHLPFIGITIIIGITMALGTQGSITFHPYCLGNTMETVLLTYSTRWENVITSLAHTISSAPAYGIVFFI